MNEWHGLAPREPTPPSEALRTMQRALEEARAALARLKEETDGPRR